MESSNLYRSQGHQTYEHRKLLLQNTHNARISTHTQKEIVLQEFLNKLGLQLNRGFLANNIQEVRGTQHNPLADLNIQLELLNLIKDCHVHINSNILQQTPEQLQHSLTQKISLLLNKPAFAHFNADEKTNFVKQLLAIITHREDGRWYCFEKSHNSYTKSAQHLIDYLSNNLRSHGHRLNEITSRMQIRQQLRNEAKGNQQPLACGRIFIGDVRHEKQAINVFTESSDVLLELHTLAGGHFSGTRNIGMYRLSFGYDAKTNPQGLNINLFSISNLSRYNSISPFAVKGSSKFLIYQDSILHSGRLPYLLKMAVELKRPVTLLVNSATLKGQVILNSRVGDLGFTDLFNVIDINPNHQLAPGTLDFTETIRQDRIYSARDLELHANHVNQLITRSRYSLDSINYASGVAINHLQSKNYEINNEDEETLRTQLDTIISELSMQDSLTSNFDYRKSEAKELIDNFAKRCTLEQYHTLKTYQDINGKAVNIESAPPATKKMIRFVLPDNYKEHAFYQKASAADKNAIDNTQYAGGVYYDNLSQSLAFELLELLPYQEEEIMSPEFSPANYSEDEKVKISELAEKVKQQISNVELANDVQFSRDNKLFIGSINQDRLSQQNIDVDGRRKEIDFYDGKLMLHSRYYDRAQMLLLLKAIKSGDEALFVKSLANLITALPNEKLAEQRNALFESFTRLFVSGKFPNEGLKLQYHHFMGRCGQIH